MWKVPKIWEGGTAIILGGGASMLKQFNIPQNVIEDVYTKRSNPYVYSPYMELIHKEHIIAINVAYKIGDWIDVMFFGDISTWNENKNDDLFDFKGLRVTCDVGLEDDRRVRSLLRNKKKPTGITTDPTMLSWNHNSGAAAINLAVHFGVKKIILLGFDMRLDEKSNQHWHKFYQTDVRQIQLTFAKHLVGFNEIAKDLEKLGIEIINCSPDSAINCFKKMDIKSALQNECS